MEKENLVEWETSSYRNILEPRSPKFRGVLVRNRSFL